ncbi:MAG TPA: esterase-like activity of phytase family protein [Thermoanaerobaculia bacterium]|jgi:3-phytase/alkaline phosphatase D|nr:esterase-like activity of phytase family protein [Thermoanaerobaculia bacterium]
MTISKSLAFTSALLIAGLGLAAQPPDSERPQTGPRAKVFLLGPTPLVVPFGTQVNGLRVGGLSAIARAAHGGYLAVVDNEGETPARVFRLELRVGEDGIAPPRGKAARQVPVAVMRLAGFDGRNFDGEGIALEASGKLLISSETEPSIQEFSGGGKLLATLPVPPPFLAAEGTGARKNQGFESLTLTPGGVLWTANERALQQDAPDDETRPSPVRLLRYERRGSAFVPGAQFVYEVEPISRSGDGFMIRGLAELLALPGGNLLALEREYVEGRGFTIQLFRVSLAGATDVSRLDSLAGRTYTAVGKTLVYDFARSGFTPDNLEGMTFGPSLADGSPTLVLVSDDNFSPLAQTQIVALRLPKE